MYTRTRRVYNLSVERFIDILFENVDDDDAQRTRPKLSTLPLLRVVRDAPDNFSHIDKIIIFLNYAVNILLKMS